MSNQGIEKITNSHARGLIEDLLISEVPFSEISKFAEKHGETITAEEIEEYARLKFSPEDSKAYRVAVRKEKIRQTDQDYEKGHVALQNSVNIINHLLEQITNRWKLLMEDKQAEQVKEKDILGYVTQIRETVKLVNELNSSLKDDNYIPIHVFYEEVEKFIGITINFLNETERDNPGLEIKNKFLVKIKDKFKNLEIGSAVETEAILD